jgi:hypothetical protein
VYTRKRKKKKKGGKKEGKWGERSERRKFPMYISWVLWFE